MSEADGRQAVSRARQALDTWLLFSSNIPESIRLKNHYDRLRKTHEDIKSCMRSRSR
jgi:hypothetical protein